MKMDEFVSYPCAMTIAGSDSGGGAGIQADLRTFNAFGVFGCAAITAVTAQNPTRVEAVAPIAPEIVQAQINTVFDKINVRTVKTGMLFSSDIIRTVCRAIKGKHKIIVVDPVMVSTSGARLLQNEAVKTMREELLPIADWITPNIPEAELLLNRQLKDKDDFIAAARELAEIFSCSVILKTGHAAHEKNKAVDYVACDGELFELGSPTVKLPDPSAAHGTGCTMSAAIAAAFALEMDVREALSAAKGFVYGSLLEYVPLQNGVYAMYPPQESYEKLTFFKPLEHK